MPIDFSILNQANPYTSTLDSIRKASADQQDRAQRDRALALNRATQMEQNAIAQQTANQTYQYQQGLLEQQRQELIARSQYQDRLLQQGQQEIGLRAQAQKDTAAFQQGQLDVSNRGMDLRALELADSKESRKEELALKKQELAGIGEERNRRYDLDVAKFNLDNSNNLFNQSLAMRDQLIKEQSATNAQLSFDQNQQYLKDIASAKTDEERQIIAQRYGRIDDAIKLGEESKRNMLLASQKGAEKFGVGLHAFMLELAHVKNPEMQASMMENFLNNSEKYAYDNKDAATLNILDATKKITSPKDKLLFLLGQGAYQAKNVGLAMQNPSANVEAFNRAQLAASPSNPYMFQNINKYSNDLSGIAQQSLAPASAKTADAQKKSDELSEARVNNALEAAQADADKYNKIAQLHDDMLINARAAGETATKLSPAPGVYYTPIRARVGDFDIPIGEVGAIGQWVSELTGRPENSSYIDQMRRGQQEIGIIMAGKRDPNDPSTARILRESVERAPGPADDLSDHEVINLRYHQAARDATDKSAALNSWIAAGNSVQSFESQYWNKEQIRREKINAEEIKSINERQRAEALNSWLESGKSAKEFESQYLKKEQTGPTGELGAYIKAKRGDAYDSTYDDKNLK